MSGCGCGSRSIHEIDPDLTAVQLSWLDGFEGFYTDEEECEQMCRREAEGNVIDVEDCELVIHDAGER